MGRQEVAAAGSGGVGRRGTGVGEFDDQIRKLRVKLENESLEILAFVNLAERFSLTSRLNPTPRRAQGVGREERFASMAGDPTGVGVHEREGRDSNRK